MNIQLKDSENNKIYPLAYYPIGAVYMSDNPKSPAEMFGGTWLQIIDNFLYANTVSSDISQGETTHVLTVDEMPSHNHSMWIKEATSSTSRANLFDGYQTVNADKYSDMTFPSTGGGEAHENMPPYLAVYMWRRIS